MPWEIENGSGTERLPVDSRFIAKMDRGITTRNEQVNSRFIKKWRSSSEYNKGVSLPSEEREVYNYVADLVANGQTVDPVAIEEALMTTSGKILKSVSKFYTQDTKVKVGGIGEANVEAPAGSYVESILASLQKKGLVRYA